MTEIGEDDQVDVSTITQRQIPRRNVLKSMVGATVFPKMFSRITSRPDQFPISSSESTAEQKFFHNGHSGFEMSSFLHGIIDLKFVNPKTGEWQLYNNVVPEVDTGNNLNNAEMFGLDTEVRMVSREKGKQVFEIEYGKFEGSRQVGDYFFDGNNAHVSVFVTLEDGKHEMGMQIVSHPDSAPIQTAALGNFFGAAQRLRYVNFNNSTIDTLTQFPTPKDGHFINGDFHTFQLKPGEIIKTWGDKTNMVQWQKVSQGGKLTLEKRAHMWRPEQDKPDFPFRPDKPWLELIRAEQQFNDNPEWHFGYYFDPSLGNESLNAE